MCVVFHKVIFYSKLLVSVLLELIIDYIRPMDAKLRHAPVAGFEWKLVSLSLFRASKIFFVNDSS